MTSPSTSAIELSIQDNGVHQTEKGNVVKCRKNPSITADDIAKEILVRAEKRKQNFPDGVDVLVAMKSPSELRLPYLEETLTPTPPPKILKRDRNKINLDASELLSILQDGAETHYVEKPKPKPKFRGSHHLDIDPELEKSLAMKQLMEFTNKRGRPRREPEANNNKAKPKIKREVKKSTNKELQRLLQDEGAVNMLYSIEKGNSNSNERLLSSKTRLKKVMKKKAEIEEALLGSMESSSMGVSLRHRSDKRKQSTESLESEHSVTDFNFPAPAEASKIIRRHSSSSSYSSRSSSPRRLSIDFDKPSDAKEETPSKIKMSVMAEKLIEMKCKELNLQPQHSDMIKQLVVEKKNGLKERLQSEFSNKFKAAAAVASAPAPKAKPVWKVVEEDWESLDDSDDGEKSQKTTSSSESKNDLSSKIKKSLASVIKQIDINKIIKTKKPTPKEVKRPKDGPIKKKLLVNSIPSTEIKMASVEIQTNNSYIKETRKSKNNAENHKETSNDIVEPEINNIKIETSSPQEKNSPFKTPLISELKISTPSEVKTTCVGSVTVINIVPTSCSLKNSFNSKILTELCQALEHVEQQGATKAIVLSFKNEDNIFCNGIDLFSLLSDDVERRKTLAAQTALALKELICKLSMLGKPVLVGVHGQAVGLGVILLAYCDYVLASETSTFYTPYPLLGYLPEGAATLALPNVIGHRMTSKLLLCCQRLSSSEAEQCGLISKVSATYDLKNDVMGVATSLCQHSQQSMQSTKALLMHSIRTRLPSVLNMEIKVLEQHWSDDDCQNRINALKDNPLF